MIVWSYGGGVQTAAIGVLIVEGALPRPDLTVMADTGREATATWDYLRDVMGPYLARAGVEVMVAPHSLATVDLYAHNGDLLIPAFTEGGKLPTFCASKWKREVVRRYLRSLGVESCEMWLGISFDERERAKASGKQWVTNAFPLIEAKIGRHGCLLLAERAGLPEPPRSSCWMCPHRGDAQWRLLRDRYPEDWAKAVKLDEDVRSADGEGGVYLHRSRVPLAMAPIDHAPDGQLELFTANCSSGYCWT